MQNPKPGTSSTVNTTKMRDNIETIVAREGKHPMEDYPFNRDKKAYRCTACCKIWMSKKEANFHICFPKDE